MSLIPVALIDDTTFLFNADDYMRIRTEHRITGRLVGSSVKWPRNLNIRGLPATFSPYETQLLIDKGIIQLRRKNFSNSPTEHDQQQYNQSIEENSKTYESIYRENKVNRTKQMMSRILAGKRNKIIKNGGDPLTVTEETVLADIEKNCIADLDNICVQIPTEDPFNTEYEEVTQAPNVDPFKYRVFKDLWEKGKWITTGDTFGGDFLIYPGEPLHFHASHIIHVLSHAQATTMPTRILNTRCRLSVSVNKLCTFVYEHSETNELCYQTVQWLGK